MDKSIGYLRARADGGGHEVVCPRCERIMRERVGLRGEREIALTPVYRVNIGSYKQSCAACGRVLVKGQTPAWPELFAPSAPQVRTVGGKGRRAAWPDFYDRVDLGGGYVKVTGPGGQVVGTYRTPAAALRAARRHQAHGGPLKPDASRPCIRCGAPTYGESGGDYCAGCRAYVTVLPRGGKGRARQRVRAGYRIVGNNAIVAKTIDNDYMVLVGGVQWGPPGSPRDRSGAASDTWPTENAAAAAFRESEARHRGGKGRGPTRYPTIKKPGDPTYSAEWSGVTGAPKARGLHCPRCAGPVHREGGSHYCPRCDDYVAPLDRAGALAASVRKLTR